MSSSERCIVSSSSSVENIPVNMNNANISKIWLRNYRHVSTQKSRCQSSKANWREGRGAYFIRAPTILQLRKANLRNDGAEFSAGSADPMRSGPVPRGERLPWDNKTCRVRTEVLEKVDEAVEEDERGGARLDYLVVAKALWGVRGSG
jgi:hypothetical protein